MSQQINLLNPELRPKADLLTLNNLALLASLVGQISQAEIAEVLTARLREKTGDPEAERTKTAVQVRTNQIGLQTTDVVGGLTTAEAAREIGSFAIVNQMIDKGELPTHRIGRLHVIPHAAWQEWKSKRVFPPTGYVQLSTIKDALGIKSDKLSEYARMGLIPTAIRCNPYGTRGRRRSLGRGGFPRKPPTNFLLTGVPACRCPGMGNIPTTSAPPTSYGRSASTRLIARHALKFGEIRAFRGISKNTRLATPASRTVPSAI